MLKTNHDRSKKKEPHNKREVKYNIILRYRKIIVTNQLFLNTNYL